MTPEARRARGIAAKMLIEDEIIRNAFDDMEADIIGEWRRSVWPWRQRMKWNELRAVERLRQRLASYAAHAPRDGSRP